MSDADVLVARMGQMQFTKSGQTLKAIMGSCVGVGLLWHKQGKYALSHCLLGESPEGSATPNAKYVSDAIPMMLEAMGVESRRECYSIRCVVVGGSAMLQGTGTAEAEEIGRSNLEAARKHIIKNGLAITQIEDARGNASQLYIDGATGEYEINIIPKLVV